MHRFIIIIRSNTRRGGSNVSLGYRSQLLLQKGCHRPGTTPEGALPLPSGATLLLLHGIGETLHRSYIPHLIFRHISRLIAPRRKVIAPVESKYRFYASDNSLLKQSKR